MGASLAELEVLINLQTIGQGQINSLKGSLLGLGTGVGIAALAVGGLYEIGKSAIDNYEDQESAINNLKQAFASQGKVYADYQSGVEGFLAKNKEFISNQSDAEQAIATAIRAGLSYNDTMNLMQDAVGLAAARHMSLADAMDILIKAAAGGRSQLAYLGITSNDLTTSTNALSDAQKAALSADDKKKAADRALQDELDRLHGKHKITQSDLDHLANLKAKDLDATKKDQDAHKKLADVQKAVNDQGDRAATLHDKLAPKLAGEERTYSQLQQDQNKLNKDWQDFSATIGPALESGLDKYLIQPLDTGVQILEEIAQMIEALASDPSKIGTVFSTIGADIAGPNAKNSAVRGGTSARGGRASGGPVYGGNTYLIGEAGPELLTMGAGSGYVTPNNQIAATDTRGMEQRQDRTNELLEALLRTHRGPGGLTAN